MKQVLISRGKAFVEEVPMVSCTENEILVKIFYSTVSIGTELNFIQESSNPLVSTEKIKNFLGLGKKNVETSQAGDNLASPIGYSAAGVIISKGKNVTKFKIGDKVACAGTGYANHAEYISVPENLAVLIPSKLSLDLASSVTLGAIALQGVRRAEVNIGENIVVFGMGLLGQLVSQILKVAGCKVFGIDRNEYCCEMGKMLGADHVINCEKADYISKIDNLTEGRGADAVIITASANDDEIINYSFEICRRMGKIVVVGEVGLNISREKFFSKEIDIRISKCFGPGRYDPHYEEMGQDYPYDYVRWTENRNMEAYLQMIDERKIKLTPLIGKVYPIDQASKAFESLSNSSRRSLMILLEYDKVLKESYEEERKIMINKLSLKGDMLGIGLIGTGNFAQTTLLPVLSRLSKKSSLVGLMSDNPSVAREMAKKYKASYSTSEIEEILDDANINLVVISTRNHMHAQDAIQSLHAGKGVLLSSPPALDEKEFRKLMETVKSSNLPFMVGYNRRYSECTDHIKNNFLHERETPLIVHYKMNVPYLSHDHWIYSKTGGGRNFGEAIHAYDFFNFLTGSELVEINALGLDPARTRYRKKDNFNVSLKYADGSLCNLIFTSMGNTYFPSEEIEIVVNQVIIRITDFKSVKVFSKTNGGMDFKNPDKGYTRQIESFIESIEKGIIHPIPLDQIERAFSIAFEVEKLLDS